jgi:hypothetical protein
MHNEESQEQKDIREAEMMALINKPLNDAKT